MNFIPQTEQELLQAIIEIIVCKTDPEQIILFGSRARGDARPDSDVDLLIIESEPFSAQRSRRKEAGRLWMALSSIDVSKDLLLYSRDEVEARKDSLNHVVGRAFREGKVLHVKN
jgi:predicted nucleotidyltransferase